MGDSYRLPAKITVQVLDPSMEAIPEFELELLEYGQDLLAGLPVDRRTGVAEIFGLFENQSLEVVVGAKGFVPQRRQVVLGPANNRMFFTLGTPGMDYFFRAGVPIPYRREEARHLVLRGPDSPPGEEALGPDLAKMIRRDGRLAMNAPESAGGRKPGLEESIAAELVVYGGKEERKEAIGAVARHLLRNPRQGRLVVRIHPKAGAYFTGEIEVTLRKMPSAAEQAAFEARFEVVEVRREGDRITFAMLQPDADFPDLVAAIKAEQEWVAGAEPLIEAPIVPATRIEPRDFLFPQQWDFQIIQMPEAWFTLGGARANQQFGSSSVIIALADTKGPLTTHPDLAGRVNGVDKIVTSFDFVANTVAYMPLGSHGTSCASAATAAANRPAATNPDFAEGVTGTAPDCRLVAANIPNGTTDVIMNRMFRWFTGITVGATPPRLAPAPAVSSNSYATPGIAPIPDLYEAMLQLASDFGRSGRGLAIFFAAGNEKSPITAGTQVYGLSDRVMAIAASTLVSSSSTGPTREERAPYSNFGTDVHICAPSNSQRFEVPIRHKPPTDWGAHAATVNGATIDFFLGNLPAAPRRHGPPPAALRQSLDANTPAGSATLVTTADTSPFFNPPGDSAVLVGDPGAAGTEGLRVTGVSGADHRIDIRYSRNIAGSQHPHLAGAPVAGGAADYCSDFGGTSYATPVVAGIAALMVSARPSLSWVEIKELLRTTSRKIHLGVTEADGLWKDLAVMPPGNTVLNEARNGIRPRSPNLATTLAAPAAAPANPLHHLRHGQSQLRLTTAAGFEIGDAIHITNGQHSDFHVIEGKAGNTITIDALRHDFGTLPATTVTAGAMRPVRSDYYGHGRVNARLAVQAAIAYSHEDRDLAIRNHPLDDGRRDIDPAVTPIHSPDIWLRNQDDPPLPAPPYDLAGPHQNPRAGNDRYIYARIKNIGHRFKNLDAWVHFYVALSDHMPPPLVAGVHDAPQITTPFLFPGDSGNLTNVTLRLKSWCDIPANNISGPAGIRLGLMNVWHVRASELQSGFNQLIPEGSVPAADPNNVNQGVTVVRVRWRVEDLPPATNLRAFYLLVYVSPVDGERNGNQAGRHNNMSYREIAFADFAIFNETGMGPLPSSVLVDAFGTPKTTAFRLQIIQSLGPFLTERVQLELTRTSGNGATEKAFFRWSGTAWELLDGGGATAGWAHMAPPTSLGAPAAGPQTNIIFDGDFACSLLHQKVTVRAIVHSARPGAAPVPIAEDSFDIHVVSETPPTPGASALHQDPPRPDSYVFTDFDLLAQPQPADKSFGPIDAGRFRITSLFRAASAPKAYAVAPGVVMVQPVDADRVNLVLRPLRQPGLGLTPVKYYVYRGLRLDHFLDPADNTRVRLEAGAPEFVARLWPIHVVQNSPGTPFTAAALGCDPANQPATGHIDQFFFAAGAAVQYAIAKAGEWLGDFFHSGNNEFGFEIVLEEGTAQPTFQNIRQASYIVDVAALPASTDTERFAKRLAREEILNYLDPAAFYGMHSLGQVRRPGGAASFTDQQVVANVVDKFATRRKVYLDIRNENGNSYNFYGNYRGTAPPADVPRNIRLGSSEAALAAAAYGTQEWPLHIVGPLTFAASGPWNPLALTLRVNDNLKPLLYVEHGEITSDTVNRRFVDETQLLPGPANPPWTKPVSFQSPNTGSGAKESIAWLFKLHYGRQIDPATVFPPAVVPTVKTLDNLFGPLDLAPLWSGGQAVRWIAAQDRKYVDGEAQGYGQTMERGVAFEGMAATGRVVFFAALTDQLRNIIPGFRPLRGITGGTSNQLSFLQSAGLLDQYRLDFGSITDGGAKITILRLRPGTFSQPALTSGVLFLGLASAELVRLQALSGLDNNYPRTVFFEELPGPFDGFRKFQLGVQGLEADGKAGKRMPAAGQEVFAYTTNGLHFSSAAFSMAEPLPTTYQRNAEESVGLQNLELPSPANFAIFLAADGMQGRFEVARDLRQLIAPGGTFQITGGGENDGTYKVRGIGYFEGSKITALTVEGTVPRSTISGSLQILPRRIEDHYLDLDFPLPIGDTQPLKSIVESFKAGVEALENGENARASLESLVKIWGQRAIERARVVARMDGHANADDRPLYWARLKMQVILKSHEYLLQHPEDSAALSQLLEARSRGLDPLPTFAGATGNEQRALLIGFDPFLLRPGAPNNNSHFSSPSASAALYFHDHAEVVHGLYLQSVILPNRFEEFDAGVVDRLIDQLLKEPQRRPALILVLGQDIDLGLHVERFATRFRSPSLADSLNLMGQPAVHYELDAAGTTLRPLAGAANLSAILPRYFETSLPVARMVPGSRLETGPTGSQAAKTVSFDQRFRLAGAAALEGLETQQSALAAPAPPPNAEVEEGSAGNFLANELFYRLAWRCRQRDTILAAGLLQLPKLQEAAGKSHALFDRARVRYFLDTLTKLLQDALTGL